MSKKLATVVWSCIALVIASAAHAQTRPSPPWQWSDIGDVGIPGEVHLAPNTEWNVSGAGHDIWGTADSFFFVYQPFRDGSITNTFLSEDFTDPFAKAGLMIRQSLDPGSPEVIVDVKPDGGIEFMTRAVQGAATTFVAGASVPVFRGVNGSIEVNATLMLTRSEDIVSAAYCVGAACTSLGSVAFPRGEALSGVAVTSHDPTTLNHVFSGSRPTVFTVPFPWSTFDVGAVGTSGHATYEDATGAFFVSGAGSDIWGPVDSFYTVSRTFGGDSTLTARVVSEQNTDPFAKAGLIMGDFAPTARRVILDVKPDGGIEFMARTSDGSSMSFVAGANASFPVWLRLTRSGAEFTGEISPDGVTWTIVGSVAMTNPTGAASGFAVTSHNPAVLNTAVFDHVAFSTAGVSGQNLLVNAGFEDSVVPDTTPGWVSDSIRASGARSEAALPHSGTQNGVCRTNSLDCGIYQEVTASSSQTYGFSIYVRADHPGALVGVNVNGANRVVRDVLVGGYQIYSMGLFANAGDVLRVWMYAPGRAGFVAIDDAILVGNLP
jgi:hypothetical protein